MEFVYKRRAAMLLFRSLNIPVAVSYSKEDPSLIGSLKADILAIRGKINDIRGKPDAETSELIMKIAKHVSSEDAQVHWGTEIRLFSDTDTTILVVTFSRGRKPP